MSASNQEPTDTVYDINSLDYEAVLADIRERYDEPLEAFPYDDATELVNAVQALADDTPAEQDRARFEEMLEDIDEQYINSHWTNTEGGEILFYGALKDAENEDAWISRSAYEDDPFTAEDSGFK